MVGCKFVYNFQSLICGSRDEEHKAMSIVEADSPLCQVGVESVLITVRELDKISSSKASPRELLSS